MSAGKPLPEFRIWHPQAGLQNGIELGFGDDGTFSWGNIDDPGVIIDQAVGVTDMAGTSIYEGDILLCYEARFEETLIGQVHGIDLYEVHEDKPLPTLDIPLAKVVVRRDGPAWVGDYVEVYGERTNAGLASHALYHSPYVYEVIGNIHENPELSKPGSDAGSQSPGENPSSI